MARSGFPHAPRWAAWLVVLAVVLVALFSYERPASTEQPIGPGAKTSSELAVIGDLDKEGRAVARANQAVEGPSATNVIRGRVVDEMFGLPVRALVTQSGGVSVFSDGKTGEFELTLEGAIGGVLRATANGFEASEKELPSRIDSEWITLSLRSTSFASVIVQDAEGLAIPHATVTWRPTVHDFKGENVNSWIRDDIEPEGRTLELDTDPLGASRVRLTVPAIASVTHPRNGTRVGVRVSPGEERVLTFSEDPVTLQFVDGRAGSPLQELDLEAWYPREVSSTVTRVRTDAEGIARVAPTSFPILIRLAGLGVWDRELLPNCPEITLAGFGGTLRPILRLDRVGSTHQPLQVGVFACGGQIRLIDDASGAAITALARFALREASYCQGKNLVKPSNCVIAAPQDESDDIDGTIFVRNGTLNLPCTLTRTKLFEPNARARWVLALDLRGYIPLRVPATTLPWSPSDPELELRLTRVKSRMLRVVQSDGRPFRRAIAIYSPLGDMIVWRSRGSEDGMHGPFDWPGEDLLVQTGDETEWEYRLHAETLMVTETATLSIPTQTGTIVVEGMPPGVDASQLVAKLGVGLLGVVSFPSSISQGTCRFDALPVGYYLVGPNAWVEGAELQSQEQARDSLRMVPRLSRVWVKQGEVTTINWMGAWESGRVIEGRILGRGPNPPELFLVPFFSAASFAKEEPPGEIPRMVFGRRSPRIALDREGRYRIGEHDPLPQLLVVCSTDDASWGTVQGLHVVETIVPGESIEIPMGSLQLVDKSMGRNRDVEVDYTVPPESLRYPLFTFHQVSRNTWAPGSALRLNCIPLSVRQISVDNHVIPIELSTSTVITLDVDLQATSIPSAPSQK